MTYVATKLAPRRELISWAMYDFANSGYTTVVLTAIFNAWFVSMMATDSPRDHSGTGTLYWSFAVGVANLLILVSAPVLGAIADYSAAKKKILAFVTVGCIVLTGLLAFAGPDRLIFTMFCLVGSAYFFGSGENLIAAFLPEIAPPDHMGRVSGYSWALGYVGGLLVLGVCLAYIEYATGQGQKAAQFVPVTLWITAGTYALAALPTFLFLQERAISTPDTPAGIGAYIRIGFRRLQHTLRHRHQYRDLFRFLFALCVFSCGIYTVIVIAAIYAQQVMGFTTSDSIKMIMIVNITAAVGAFLFGKIQDTLGARRTLLLTLLLWIVAITIAWQATTPVLFWVSANLIGVALGSSQSAGRTLVGLFSPHGRSAEFFGLWGLSIKAAAIIGPLLYGLIAWYSRGDHRLAIISTLVFFIAGLLLLLTVSEKRGREQAQIDSPPGRSGRRPLLPGE